MVKLLELPEFLMNRAQFKDLSPELQSNALEVLKRVNEFFKDYSGTLNISSGYRPLALNAKLANAGANSHHTRCAAIDLRDSDGKLWIYCISRLDEAQKLKLWLEDKRWTPTWVHLQIYAPRSGRRIFVPSSKSALAPHAWSGTYDAQFDRS